VVKEYINNFFQATLNLFNPTNLLIWWEKFITIIIILVVAKITLSVINKLVSRHTCNVALIGIY